MGVLGDSLARQIANLEADKARIEQQAIKDVAAIDTQLAALGAAARVVTKDVEESYALLLKMGLISAVQTR